MHKPKRSRLKNLALNVSLLILSLVVSLFLSEVVIRVLRPNYTDLVHSSYKRQRFRHFDNPVDSVTTFMHPDTGVPHLLIRNALGFTQSRDFELMKKPGVTRIKDHDEYVRDKDPLLRKGYEPRTEEERIRAKYLALEYKYGYGLDM